MNYIQMIIRNHVWRLEKESGRGMDNIGIFLASDIGWHGAPDFHQWLLDKTIDQMEGNYSLLIRKEENVVINCKYAQNFYVGSFKLSSNVLADLLFQWEQMCQKCSQGLSGAYIAYDGTKFNLTPQF